MNSSGVYSYLAERARMPMTIMATPVKKVMIPNGRAKQVLFLEEQRQQPLIEVIRIKMPMMRTGRA